MVYYSKKDSWLVALVSGAIVIPLLIGIYNLLASGGNHQVGWSSMFIAVFTGALVLWLTYPLYYEITSSELKIRCGMLIRQQILLGAITEVMPTRNALSAPTWSLDRLRVRYRRDGEEGVVHISPAEKESFMEELVSREAGLVMQSGRVVRA